MFPGCPEHCNAEGALDEYSWNIACWLGNKTLSVEEYLNKIRPYLKDIINDLKKSDI